MSTFPIRDDEYSVEEISYDDMMYVLSLQGQNVAQPAQVLADEQEIIDESSNKDNLAKRLADNANKVLPDWLLNG